MTPEILKVVERHTRDYQPFDVYARSLQQYFLGHEETASEWEEENSKIYPILARYQKDGYHALLKRANNHGGAFLCDGVGLGKTFIGLMLIERFIQHENKNVALFVPKAAKGPVWERELQKRLPEVFKGYVVIVPAIAAHPAPQNSFKTYQINRVGMAVVLISGSQGSATETHE